ncbi:MAG TPA: LytTR family DNA-binding domain-containing protein [Longimicrobiales bacterium]|nr:LytTR family DNA-binding domain-containing protein [Longimicrobiales bacterium]
MRLRVSSGAGFGAPDFPRFIGVRRERRIQLVDVRSIDGLVARGRRTLVSLRDGTSITAPDTLVSIERRLSPRIFLRVSRNAVVRLESVVQLDPLSDGSLRLHLASGLQVRTSRHPERLLDILRGWCYRPRAGESA